MHWVPIPSIIHCSTSHPSMEATSSNERLLNQLVLYAPLISTRRSSSSIITKSVNRSNSTRRQAPSNVATQRVPFSWESSPGVPKVSRALARPHLDEYDDEHLPLPPKLPPSLWYSSREDNSTNGKERNLQDEARNELGDPDESSNGSDDGDDNNGDGGDDDDDDIFSDALDKISLSEKLDIACRLSSFNDLASNGIERNVHRSPSFIMNRFLPAANALANSSVRNDVHCSRRAAPSSSYHLEKDLIKARVKHRASVPRLEVPFDPYAEARTDLPSMACGLMLFFPWSFKPTVCGFKSPARPRTPRPDLTSSPKRVMKGCSDDWSSESFKPTVCGFKSPARRQTPRPDLTSSPKRIIKGCGDGWSSDTEDNDGGHVAKLSTKVNHSHGWGLPFLDTSRLRTRGKDVERRKAKERKLGIGCESNQNGRNEVVPAESRRAMWRLPQLTDPSESWLAHALSSINRQH